MIRVIYRWEVESENFEDFRRAWRRATNSIHETVPGAMGSFMLRSSDRNSEVLTVAKWQSAASWKAFWGKNNPQAMEEMHRLGKRLSVNVYDEIEDHTR